MNLFSLNRPQDAALLLKVAGLVCSGEERRDLLKTPQFIGINPVLQRVCLNVLCVLISEEERFA